MTERPIPFNAPMVRAVIAGTKTQTRRPVKPQAWSYAGDMLGQPVIYPRANESSFGDCDKPIRCPYGAPGDRLWVRETWSIVARIGTVYTVAYRANSTGEGESLDLGETRDIDVGWEGPTPKLDAMIHELPRRWRRSVHMPRWASRLTLDVVNVRVERVQDITEADARAEGITDGGCLTCGNPEPCGCDNPMPDARDSFAFLWETIYGSYSWQRNDWVWVVEFKRCDQ